MNNNILTFCNNCILKNVCIPICLEYKNKLIEMKNNFEKDFKLYKHIEQCLICGERVIKIKIDRLNMWYKCPNCNQLYYSFLDYICFKKEDYKIEISTIMVYLIVSKNDKQIFHLTHGKEYVL